MVYSGLVLEQVTCYDLPRCCMEDLCLSVYSTPQIEHNRFSPKSQPHSRLTIPLSIFANVERNADFFFLFITGTLHIGLLTVPTLQTPWSLVKSRKVCLWHDFVLHSLCILSMFADKINDTKFCFFPLIIVFFKHV